MSTVKILWRIREKTAIWETSVVAGLADSVLPWLVTANIRLSMANSIIYEVDQRHYLMFLTVWGIVVQWSGSVRSPTGVWYNFSVFNVSFQNGKYYFFCFLCLLFSCSTLFIIVFSTESFRFITYRNTTTVFLYILIIFCFWLTFMSPFSIFYLQCSWFHISSSLLLYFFLGFPNYSGAAFKKLFPIISKFLVDLVAVINIV